MFERELRLYKTVHKIPKRKLPRKTNLVYGNQKKKMLRRMMIPANKRKQVVCILRVLGAKLTAWKQQYAPE